MGFWETLEEIARIRLTELEILYESVHPRTKREIKELIKINEKIIYLCMRKGRRLH